VPVSVVAQAASTAARKMVQMVLMFDLLLRE
jgi:hypothetical protein